VTKIIDLKKYRESKEKLLLYKETEDLLERIRKIRSMAEEYNKRALEIVKQDEKRRENVRTIKEITKDRDEPDVPD
jgi:hypothetical protein